MALVAGWGGMLKALDHAWRVAAAGLGFAIFFGGGALAAVTLLPLIGYLTRDSAARGHNTRRVMHVMFAGYLLLLRGLGVMRIQIEGRALLGGLRGKLIVANHPSLLDVVLLMAVVPRVQCIVKHQLWASRLLGGVVRQAGYIRNDLPADEMMAACRAALASGSNLIIFPQGTRTPSANALHFHRGFANIAMEADVEIQTVKITCDPPYLGKGERWWQVPARRPTFRVVPGACLAPYEQQAQARPLAARALVRRLESYFTGFLANG
jgi:1-acyl-sn-glycerol-3-phosphate acyltransferase